MRFQGYLLLLLVTIVACLSTNTVAENRMHANEVTESGLVITTTQDSREPEELPKALDIAATDEERYFFFIIIPDFVLHWLSSKTSAAWHGIKGIFVSPGSVNHGDTGTSGKKIHDKAATDH
uniref:RxLR effector protein n=1 Tax=Peronospora matthiolae TaxID=2874970 RepID=A0AAV1U7E2_9STRA